MPAQAKFFDLLYIRFPRRWLGVILLAYLLLATNYALLTPPWQAPDEPAHYNNIAEIFLTRALPVLDRDDYNQQVQAAIISAGFPPDASLAQFQYESYQPPLYYLLATPIFGLTGGNLVALRLFSVLLGAGTIWLIYRAVELVFGAKTLIVVGATAFAALLPMQVAINAAVNNDGLAHLLVAAALLLLLRWMQPYFEPGARPDAPSAAPLIWLGIVLGLGLLTKVYAYLLLPICALVVLLTSWRCKPGGSLGQGLTAAVYVITPALLLGLPLWLRNWRLYGPWDILGTMWHDQVVAGQPLTADWIADQGWVTFGERAISFTFKSFWGVFGWLGIFMDERIYTACLIFSGVLFLGLLWSLVRWVSGGVDLDLDSFQQAVLGLFAVLLLAVLAGYVWYNAKFVQHQGRYFFWGMLPISTFVALGWREVLRPLQGVVTGFLAGVLTAALVVTGYSSSAPDKWTILLTGLFALFLLVQPILLVNGGQGSTGWRRPVQVLLALPLANRLVAFLRFCAFIIPFALLLLLNFLIPGLFILPQLAH